MRVKFRRFDSGWWPMGAAENVPTRTLRRATGVHSIKAHVLRSRPGSTLLYALDAHSLFKHQGTRYQGAGTEFFRSGVSIRAMLNGNRLFGTRMSPTAGVADYLFIAGGGDLFKVDAAGTPTQWGIDAPGTDPTGVDFAVGLLGAGNYKYKITFRNSVSGHRSNANAGELTVATGANRLNRISNIPVSADVQVDQREVWRTVAGGTAYFKLATIPDNATTQYDDNINDTGLSSTSLPTDNAVPNDLYGDCVGPHYGRIFWGRFNSVGKRGRIPYSAIDRPEADIGFIDVTTDDDPNQRVLMWNGSVWSLTSKTLYQILGTDEPFTPREVQGAPGCINPYTVCMTPYGIVYQAQEGIVIFNGAQVTLVGYDAVGLIFRGEALEGVGPISGTAHCYAKAEYFISDGVSTVAVNLSNGTWRNVGVGCHALFYEPDTGSVIGTVNGNVVVLEDVGQTTDAGTAITFQVETPAALSDVKKPGLVQRLYIEANTRGQWVTPTIYIDGTAYARPPFVTNTRTTQEFAYLKSGKLFSVRLDAALTAQIDIFGIEMDIDVGTEPIVPQPVLGSKTGVVPVAQATAAST